MFWVLMDDDQDTPKISNATKPMESRDNFIYF